LAPSKKVALGFDTCFRIINYSSDTNFDGPHFNINADEPAHALPRRAIGVEITAWLKIDLHANEDKELHFLK
jgi:hypothetical protein